MFRLDIGDSILINLLLNKYICLEGIREFRDSVCENRERVEVTKRKGYYSSREDRGGRFWRREVLDFVI